MFQLCQDGRVPPRSRRTDALSRERIVEAAIGLLDASGPDALTFRALGGALNTGSGAIYHHVAGKDELLAAATDAVLRPILAAPPGGADPRETIRALALALFDAIDAHPWLAAQVMADPGRPANLLLSERIGGAVLAMGTPEAALFDAATAVVGYVLGSAAQNAANARSDLARSGPSRAELLGGVASRIEQLDPDEFPYLRRIAATIAGHDDRAQFLAGLDLLLAGIDAL
ncbi:Bacterial regulatory proteins, tetR family [Tsukamurella paurometabola]|uniref:Bacterial regulatory proteins, tetR family n=1 Tax=Tsukamurella paurometabola TaxID=2061 RepID=A0A3P8L057_TSUPA|nr:Bacterial regulatory proteins, tetR family [Tsukamurella paurometabola]